MNRLLPLAAIALAALLGGCATLAPPEGRNASFALTDTAETRLGRALATDVAANPGKTGIHQLPDPRDAFAARIVLAQAAQKTLDVQYFIWHRDQVGAMMFEALWNAAERGVRVRVLLDDLNMHGLDDELAAVAAQPNLEVRLYNPLQYRRSLAVNFLTDFTRVNHRMHNKSFTADNQVTIVGGRNIANEYFGVGAGAAFADLDVVAVGSAVRDVSAAFDLYWNSASAYPAVQFVGPPGPDADARTKQRFAESHADPESIGYLDAVRATPLLRDLLEGKLQFEWVTATLVRDDPAKTLDTSNRTDVLLFPELLRTIGRPEESLDLVSPYFVPGDDGTANLAALARRGVKVRVLTNSMSATDEASVYAGYAKRRKALLQAGVRLYELKPILAKESDNSAFRFGQSASSALHAKTFAVDGARIFVGSFNLDQRSARLNTEMGLVIDSRVLAGRLGKVFDTEVPAIAYEVRLRQDGESLEWIERTAAGEVRHGKDPGTSWAMRFGVDVLSLLPIEWLL